MMTPILRLLLTLALLLSCGAAARAADAEANRAMVETILGDTPPAENLFSPEFLATVPYASVLQTVASVREQLGTPFEIIPSVRGSSLFILSSPSMRMNLRIGLDRDGLIATLLVDSAVRLDQDTETILAEIAALGGDVSYLVTRDGDVLHGLRQDEPLAVGSAYKIGVLAALIDSFDAGETSIYDTADFTARFQTLGGGLVNSFPIGSPFTLHTLATLMISQSDNAATDILMDIVGRQAAAEKFGLDFLLTTRELFQLKSFPDWRDRYLATTTNEQKLALMAELAEAPPPDANLIGPLDPGVEWYIPATALCAAQAPVARNEFLSVNPGPILSEHWGSTAFKGGSEIGVLNFTTTVRGPDADYCFVLTWNGDGPLDEARAAALYASLAAGFEAQ